MAEPQDSTPAAIKDPNEWTTGDEVATAAQLSYLHTLAQEAGQTVETDGLTKAAASKEIERLQQASGRSGAPTGSSDGDSPE